MSIIRRLMYLPDYANDAQCWYEHDLQMAGCVPQGIPSVMRTRRQLYACYGYGGGGIGDEPPYHNSDLRDLYVEYIGEFEGRGAVAIAAQGMGGEVTMPAEKYQVARVLLRRKFPSAMTVEDFDNEDWRDWRRRRTAALRLTPPTHPYAPAGVTLGQFPYKNTMVLYSAGGHIKNATAYNTRHDWPF